MSGQTPINRPYQQGHAFKRPVTSAAPPPRRRKRRGRAREALRTALAVGLVASAPLLLWAWQEGHAGKLWGWAGEKAVEASLAAGLSVQTIRVAGHARTPDAAIIEALGVAEGDALFALDMGALRHRLEALPWVRRAVVTRELPGTLKVVLEERVPVARWQIRGTLKLVGAEGVPIAVPDVTPYSGLPLLVGAGAPEAAPALFAMLAREPWLAERVVAAIRVGQRRWDIEFDTGVRLKLPEAGEDYGPDKAWVSFAALAEREDAFRMEVASFDLRLPGRIVMKLTGEGENDFVKPDRTT